LLILSEVFRYRELIFDAVPGVSRNVFPVNVFLVLWLTSLLFLLSGLFTRMAAICNYLFVVMATSLFANSNVGTFNDDLLRIGSFLCIFMPVAKSFSLDVLKNNIQFRDYPPAKTTQVFYILFLFLSLGLLYLPSGLTKTYSPMWVHGLGLWIPCNIPHNKWNELPNLIVNHYWLLSSLNYLVIIWEIAFVFILFIPRLHYLIVIPGLIFHLGIALLFPFPAVCTGPLVFYVLFIPDSWWEVFYNRIQMKVKIPVSYNPNVPSQYRMARFIEFLDYRKRYLLIPETGSDDLLTYRHMIQLIGKYATFKWLSAIFNIGIIRRILKLSHRIWISGLNHPSDNRLMNASFRYTLLVYFTISCALLQAAISSYHVYSHYHSGAEKRMEYMRKRKEGQDFSMKPTNLARTFLGINSRGLFLDHANTGQKTTRGITIRDHDGMETWLPMIDQKGYVCRELNMNMAWAKVTFNLFGFGAGPLDTSGVQRLTRYWALIRHLPLNDLTFKVYAKTYTYPDHFEKDYYLKLERIPWKSEGEARWINGRFSFISSDTSAIH
jgi:hypothetical protein